MPTRLFRGKKQPSSSANAGGKGPSAPLPKHMHIQEPAAEVVDLTTRACCPTLCSFLSHSQEVYGFKASIHLITFHMFFPPMLTSICQY
ncbi:hypothetical protein DL93DRAFT_2087753 [Clavulina sp. PMI_390]|nr:hypothetical protein DL93DRAFT_2092202 [Clavulina sp. PMI_390]KAF8307760.1 hypothetical protein DL93DRAFT_2087753 [Clavulina sp. PMI_390]